MRLCDVCGEKDQKKIKANVKINGFEKFADMNMGGGRPIINFDDIDICDVCLQKLKTMIRDFLKPGKYNT